MGPRIHGVDQVVVRAVICCRGPLVPSRGLIPAVRYMALLFSFLAFVGEHHVPELYPAKTFRESFPDSGWCALDTGPADTVELIAIYTSSVINVQWISLRFPGALSRPFLSPI